MLVKILPVVEGWIENCEGLDEFRSVVPMRAKYGKLHFKLNDGRKGHFNVKDDCFYMYTIERRGNPDNPIVMMRVCFNAECIISQGVLVIAH